MGSIYIMEPEYNTKVHGDEANNRNNIGVMNKLTIIFGGHTYYGYTRN